MQCQCIQNKQLSIFRFLASKFDFSVWLLYGCSYLVHCGEGAQSPLLGRERAPLLTTWAAFDLMSAGGKKKITVVLHIDAATQFQTVQKLMLVQGRGWLWREPVQSNSCVLLACAIP